MLAVIDSCPGWLQLSRLRRCWALPDPSLDGGPARPLRWLHICWMSKECGYMPETLAMTELWLHKKEEEGGGVSE